MRAVVGPPRALGGMPGSRRRRRRLSKPSTTRSATSSTGSSASSSGRSREAPRPRRRGAAQPARRTRGGEAALDVPTETVNYDSGPEVPVEVTDPAIEAFRIAEPRSSARRCYRLARHYVVEYVRLRQAPRHTGGPGTGERAGAGADVSFLAAMLVDKFCWHLPIYRQQVFSTPASRSAAPPWSTGRAAPSTCWRRAGALKPSPGDGRDLHQGRAQGERQDAQPVYGDAATDATVSMPFWAYCGTLSATARRLLRLRGRSDSAR